MFAARRGCVGLLVAAVGLTGTVALAAAAGGQGAAARTPRERPARPAAAKPVTVRSGVSALDSALGKLELAADKKTAVADALKAWSEKQAAAAKELADKQKALRDQVAAEKDKAKKAELQKQLDGLKGPTDVEKYESAKATIKGQLTAEQLTKLDELVKAAQTETAMKAFTGQVEGWSKKGVELNAEQTAKVGAAKAKLAEDLGKLAAGASREAQSIQMKAVWDARKTVLTAEQQAKLAPAGGGEQPRAEGSRRGPPTPKPAPEAAPEPAPEAAPEVAPETP